MASETARASAKHALPIFLLGSAVLWSFSLFVWMKSGFGYAPMIEFRIRQSLVFGLLFSSPLWLAGLSAWSTTRLARVVRICALLTLILFFACLGKIVATQVVFDSLPWRPALDYWGNIFLFRFPFILAFVAMCVLAVRVWSEFRPDRPLLIQGRS